MGEVGEVGEVARDLGEVGVTDGERVGVVYPLEEVCIFYQQSDPCGRTSVCVPYSGPTLNEG